MKAVVIGGAGYIGASVVYEMLRAGYAVAVVDHLSTGQKARVHREANFYEGDIRDLDFLKIVFTKERPDAVLHLATRTGIQDSIQHPLDYYYNNVYGSMVLLDAMEALNIKNLIFSSSSTIYGNVNHYPVKESEALQPVHTYGETMLAIERMMDCSARAGKLNYAALRYTHAAGANQWASHMSAMDESAVQTGEIPQTLHRTSSEAGREERNLIKQIMQYLQGQRRNVEIHEAAHLERSGDVAEFNKRDFNVYIRDYVHVTDIASAHIQAMKYLLSGEPSAAFNLGNENGFSEREIIETAERLTGRRIPCVMLEDRGNDPRVLTLSSECAKDLLRWRPSHSSLEEIVETTLQYNAKLSKYARSAV